MNHPPAFIVTVERNLKRAKHTQQLFQQQGINAELWLGVDGTQPIKFNPEESLDRRAFSAQTFAQKHPTMIGCSLSHYRLWKHALKHNMERILVFEDDAVPMPNLKRLMPQILALDSSYEHINLGPYDPPPPLIANQHQLTQQIDWDQMLVRTVRHGFGTIAYAVNSSGIKKMMPLMMPIKATIDRQKDRPIWEAGMRAFDLWPQLVISVGGDNLIIYSRAKALRKLFIRITQPRLVRANKRLAASNSRAANQYTQKCLREHTPSGSRATKHKPLPGSNSIHAFVITAPQRRNVYDTLSALKHSGIHAQSWEGVNPNSFQLQRDESIRNRLWMAARFGSSKPPGLIAQYLSHYRLMQHAIKHKLERILVIDDGCMPNPGLSRITAQIANLDNSFEFICLNTRKSPYAIRHQQHEWLAPLHNEYQLVPALDLLSLKGGYIASLTGLRKLLPLLMPIRNSLTATIESIAWIQSVRTFQVWPRAATPINNFWATYDTKTTNSTVGNAILAASRKLNAAITPKKTPPTLQQQRTQAFLTAQGLPVA